MANTSTTTPANIIINNNTMGAQIADFKAFSRTTAI
jgi:hypothetical protein